MTDKETTPEITPEIVESNESEIVVTPEPEIAEIIEPEIVEPVEEELVSVIKVDPKVKGAMPIPAAMVSLPQPAGPAVVSDGLVDEVKLSACVYKNLYAKKSLTVHHLQRRLNELGYTVAYGDRDGWYGEGTQRAIDAFREDRKIKSIGTIDAETFLAIFDGDPNVDPIV